MALTAPQKHSLLRIPAHKPKMFDIFYFLSLHHYTYLIVFICMRIWHRTPSDIMWYLVYLTIWGQSGACNQMRAGKSFTTYKNKQRCWLMRMLSMWNYVLKTWRKNTSCWGFLQEIQPRHAGVRWTASASWVFQEPDWPSGCRQTLRWVKWSVCLLRVQGLVVPEKEKQA